MRRRLDQHRRAYDLAKAGVDRVTAAALLLITSPLTAAVAGLVRATLGDPVLFRQVRAGRDGRPFVLVKFRTMVEPGPGEDRLATDAVRLTRIGRVLRSTSLDELPTLWNVVRGDMSFVGPRPLLPEYLPLYSPHQARRHEVRPGITGLAQVSGRNALGWADRLDLDVAYVDRRDPALDLAVLGRTLGVVLRGRGVRADGHSTMPAFTGSVAGMRMARTLEGDS